MKLWLSKNSEVSVRDQLVAQVTLGIASGDLAAGERLPSTREMARRFHIHPNTVSSAYRELARIGLVEFKKGSGVFVIDGKESTHTQRLDEIVADFLNRARSAGYSKQDIENHLRNTLRSEPPRGILVIESDTALREILINEIQTATSIQAEGITFENFSSRPDPDGKRLAAMFDEKEKLQPILPAEVSCTFLKANSVPNSLSGRTRPSSDDLIAIVSGWEKFISFAKLFLLAAKIDQEMFISRLTTDRGWKKSADRAALIICDSLTAKEFPEDSRVRVFQLIAASSLGQLRKSTQSLI